MASTAPSSEQLLARFQAVELEAANPRSELEAIRDGDRILFRRGSGMVRLTGYILLAFYMIAGTGLCSWTFRFGSTPGLIATALVIAFISWSLIRPSRTFQQWTHFALDPSKDCIEVYDRRKPVRVIPLSDVRCFVAWRVRLRRDSMADIYAAIGERTLQRLTGGLGTFGDEKRNARILGHVCGVPAHYVETDHRPYEERGIAQLDLRPVLTPATLVFDPDAERAAATPT